MSRRDGADSESQLDAIRARGERLTPQRLMVLDAVRDLAGHQTAEAIYAHVRARYPYANLATIYRALAWLKEHSLVSETDLGGGQIEYEFLGERRHHHLVCLRCGMQAEFGDAAVESLAETLRQLYDFEPRIDHLAIFGVCRRCREAAGD